MSQIKKYLGRLYTSRDKGYFLRLATGILFAAVLLCPTGAARAVQISDEPMETQVQSAAANIMFILDNSGSMDWEFLTQGTDGKFEGNIEYVFSDPGGDNTYPILTATVRYYPDPTAANGNPNGRGITKSIITPTRLTFPGRKPPRIRLRMQISAIPGQIRPMRHRHLISEPSIIRLPATTAKWL